MYFVISDPYYALIKARNIDDAVEEYQRTVSDAWTEDELDDLYREMKRISLPKAFVTYVKCSKQHDELSFFESLIWFIRKKKTDTLLVDASLL